MDVFYWRFGCFFGDYQLNGVVQDKWGFGIFCDIVNQYIFYCVIVLYVNSKQLGSGLYSVVVKGDLVIVGVGFGVEF